MVFCLREKGGKKRKKKLIFWKSLGILSLEMFGKPHADIFGMKIAYCSCTYSVIFIVSASTLYAVHQVTALYFIDPQNNTEYIVWWKNVNGLPILFYSLINSVGELIYNFHCLGEGFLF